MRPKFDLARPKLNLPIIAAATVTPVALPDVLTETEIDDAAADIFRVIEYCVPESVFNAFARLMLKDMIEHDNICYIP